MPLETQGLIRYYYEIDIGLKPSSEHHNKKTQDTTRYYDENFKFSFKQIIWDAFGEQDKTLKEIDIDMGVSNGYLSSLRSGNSIPRVFSPRLKEFCDYLGCTEEMEALYNTR